MFLNDRNVRAKSTAVHLVESLETRVLRASDVRSFDGSGNNLANPTWGKAGTTLVRLAPAAFGDGKSTPAGATRASPRAISNAVVAQGAEEEINSATHLSAFAYVWGQFIDHDMDNTGSSSANGTMTIAVPKGDPSFDPASTGTKTLTVSRSNYQLDSNGVRQQVNGITSYIDGSQVYGSDAVRAAALRSFVGGKLRTSGDNLLPLNTLGLANDNDAHLYADSSLFLAGDVRANENSELTALQTLFMREHNRLAGLIAAKNPAWGDEAVYQYARKLVVAEIQDITYNEYLPALLGKSAVAKYAGYKTNVNAAISNEFSTAAYRLGHSMLADDVEFINNDGSEAHPQLPLFQVFANPTVVSNYGIDTTLKYLASSNSQEIDTKVVTSLRNFLFGPPGAGGMDLASINIQRGRDNGLAGYNATRVALGLSKLTKFSQITSDATVAAKLASVYKSVDDVDLWVGGLAEDHVAGSNLGVTFQKIVVDQFTRTRDGDRFWFERDLGAADLAGIYQVSLAGIIASNTGITNLQDNVFVFNAAAGGNVYTDLNADGKKGLLEFGRTNVTVNLYDSDGVLSATTKTDLFGNYSFAGIQLGAYKVVPVTSGRSVLTNAASQTIYVTRSQTFSDVSFGINDFGVRSSTYTAGKAVSNLTTAIATRFARISDDIFAS